MIGPALSVVMSNYNHARFMPDSLGAILDQSYRPTEILIVDDGSTDDSVAVLEQYAARVPGVIRVIRNERNLGVIANIRRLLPMATGEYVYAGACDDKLLPGFFERSVALLAEHPQAGLCSTLSAIMNESGEYEGLVRHPIVRRHEAFLSPVEVLTELKRQPSWFMPSTNVYRRAALIDAGGFMPELGHYCDGFISLVLALRHGACFIPEPLAVWRRMAGTYSTLQSVDVARTVAMITVTEQLMRSTYADVFPSDYVDEWKREMYFGAASGMISRAADGRFDQLERLIPNHTRADGAFLRAIRLWPALGRLAKPYLLLRMRPRHLWRTLWRQFLYAADPRLRKPVRLGTTVLPDTKCASAS